MVAARGKNLGPRGERGALLLVRWRICLIKIRKMHASAVASRILSNLIIAHFCKLAVCDVWHEYEAVMHGERFVRLCCGR